MPSSALDIARQLPWPPQFTCRVLRNRFTDTWHGRDEELRATRGAVGEEWKNAYQAGDPDASNTLVGEAVGLIHDVVPTKEAIDRIVQEAAALLAYRGDRT